MNDEESFSESAGGEDPVSELLVVPDSLRKLRLIRDIGAIAVVLGALAFVVFSTISNRGQEADLREETRQVRRELVSAAAFIEEKRSADAEIVECITRYTYAIQAASSVTLGAIGDLVVVISTTVAGPERDAAITDQIDLLAQSTLAYNEKIQERIDYDTTVRQLPCPLAPGLNG